MWLFVPITTLMFAIGIAIAPLVGASAGFHSPGVAIVLCGFVAACRRHPPLVLLFASFLFLTLGIARSNQVLSPGVPVVPGGEQIVIADVRSSCRPARPACSTTARLRSIYENDRWRRIDLRARLVFREAGVLPVVGDQLLVRAKLSTYESGLHAYAFDAQRWAAVNGVDAIGIVEDPFALIDERAPSASSGVDGRPRVLRSLEQRTDAGARSLFRAIDVIRARFERVVIERLGETGEAGVLLAMTTGTKSLLSDELRRDFAAAGIAHVLAVSGMHLGLIAMVFYAGLWRLIARIPPLCRRIPAQRSASLVTIVFIALYVVFTGFPVSAVRAGLMAFFVLAPRVMGRASSGLHALCFAALCLLALNPRRLGDLGFQLSVCATASLILLHLPAAYAFGESRAARAASWLANATRSSIIVSTVTAVATFPSLLWAFGTIPASSQLGNLLLVPPLALVALPATIVGVLLEMTLGIGVELLDLASAIVTLCGDWIAWWRPWFCAEAYWGRPSTVGLVGWCMCAAASPWMFRMGLRHYVALGVLVGPLLCMDLPPTLSPSGDLEIHAIPVGQGDATLVVFPEGTTMLIDAGGTGFGENRTGLQLVLPYIRGLGYGRVDVVVNSHGDADHIAGLLPLMPFIRPRDVWVGEPDPGKHLEALLYKSSIDNDATYVMPHDYTRRVFVDGVSVDVYPSRPGFESNDSGLVFRVCHTDVCALFVGDIEGPRERQLIEAHAELAAQYLKVGHHGSRTSTSQPFLDRVAPSVAVIQLGYENRFGFPHATVMRRFEERGIPVERTDRGEAIVHVTDGERLWRVEEHQPWVRGFVWERFVGTL